MNNTISNDYPGLTLMKEIASSVTIFFCFILIITYFISFLQVKFNILAKENNLKQEVLRKERYSHSSFIENSGLQVKEEKAVQKSKKIGLGSHYMFFLILSNFFGGITELIFLFTDEKNLRPEFNDDKETLQCQIFGLLHNFFDLSSVCWTTMLTYLFYKSTNLSNEILYRDTKYLLIGSFYWLLSCGIFCLVPFFEKEYGFAETYCSFRNKEKNESGIELKFWTYSFIVIVLLNSIFNCFWFAKTTKFYSNKLKILFHRKNLKEYKLVNVYVRVFQIFPIVLIITRFIKLVSVFFIFFGKDKDQKKIISKIFVYLNGFLFNINGAFNSLACIYFFRGVFWCCCSIPENDTDNNDDNEVDNKNELYEPVAPNGSKETNIE